MRSILEILAERVSSAVARTCNLQDDRCDPMLRKSQDEKFGDYQSNCAMGLAKRVGAPPLELAQRIIEHLEIDDVCATPEIAGKGFINLRLRPEFVGRQLTAIPPEPDGGVDRLGIAKVAEPTVVALDMSSPNLAKEMHVGHLRSTVIGDCIGRLLEFAGHTVHRINHVGDWGTQFGMLLAYLRRTQPESLKSVDELIIDDLERFYVQAKALFDSDLAFAEESRRTVVELQSEEPQVMAVWRAFCAESLRHCHSNYDLLDVRLEDRGESFYRCMLADVVRAYQERGLAVESQGAICIFLEGYKTREGEPLPMIIRKSDGGYNYDTTDLAAVRHRTQVLGATRLIYVVGLPQKQHLEMLFKAAKLIGWGEDAEFRHVGFGSVLGKDGRPFKTRTGGNIKLKDLLSEAIERARNVVVSGERPASDAEPLDAESIEEIAKTVAVASIKYFDLSHGLASDYRFDWDTMLAMEGNTAPYMLYAYARIRSIARRAGVEPSALPSDTPIVLEHPTEIRLGKSLLRFAEIIVQVTDGLSPNVLTEYLYDLSKAFSLFYDRRHGVRIIDAEPESTRHSRLKLCDLTARVLRLGLGLLGIKTVERM